ncbi:Crp/Fnr family transcriptional regulator [Mucilaginibacter sp. BT774]|uniref:Crp/Fnr family transcriptional regulator n=1 Tax=Mucilaginibacter sp. BT774 TaxID=3062276 RepID=UPI002674D8BC|nr:Crp/Fnr family transcriptional regulator [Mucilaginibacter sp. BT774]MDO3626490.1 Crp/Fnr family transcriptional regulator [Mucilaginibacter sp. BT774]
MIDSLINFLRLFKNIPQADAEIIESELSFRKVAEDEVLFEEGHICREMFFICKGVLRIVAQNDKGNRMTYFFLKENQFCSILNSFNNNIPSLEGIEAACEAELVVLKKQKLYNLYEKLPYLKELITGITTQSLLEKINVRNSYLGEDAATRYRHFLMRQPDIALRVSLSDIASYLGITQQSLSRIRKNMR